MIFMTIMRRGVQLGRMKEEKKAGVGDIEEASVTVEAVDPTQFKKKQRRCWSPELHKLFLDALQHLGGPCGAYLLNQIDISSHLSK